MAPVMAVSLPTQDQFNNGQVPGKGTHQLEGYEIRALGYFGPNELPQFDSEFFHIHESYGAQYILQELKARIHAGGIP